MKNNFSSSSFNQSFVYLYFLTIFLICWLQIGDYGATLDDELYYLNGVNSYEYIKNFFLSFFDNDINLSEYKSKVKEWPIVFELFLVFVCNLFNISQIENIYLTAHKINFIIFFCSLIIFYKFINKRFENNFISIVAVSFVILSPRIFAESFYNSRDIFFMSLFIFYTYSGYNFLAKKNILNTIIFAFFTALLINAKILGLIPFTLFCLLYLYNYLNTKIKLIKNIKIFLFYLLSCITFIYLLWPFLWSSPFNNLLFAFKNILKDHENIIIINNYFGNYIPSNMMPWHYRLVWFFLTTPISVVLLFIGGLILSFKNKLILITKSLNDSFEFEKKQFTDLFLLLVFLGSFFIVLEFNKSKFGGWRHLYFLYPITIYFCIYFINFLLNSFLKTYYRLIIFCLIALNFGYNFLWSINNHPHQYIFFNLLVKKYAMNNFDLDWWGISHKSSIKYILNNDKSSKIKIYAIGFTSLRNSYLYLNEKDKSRVIISDYKNSNYIIDTKMKRIRVNYNLNKNKNFKLIYQLKSENYPISSIYKRIN